MSEKSARLGNPRNVLFLLNDHNQCVWKPLRYSRVDISHSACCPSSVTAGPKPAYKRKVDVVLILINKFFELHRARN